MHLFKTPLSFIFAGSSGSGKTQLVTNIIGRLSEVFDRPPKQITICYARQQSLYNEIKNSSPIPVTLIEGLPDDLRLLPRTLLIIDDLQEHSAIISHYFTKNVHHYDLILIYITQNLFLNTPGHRTASLNASCLVIFKNPRDFSQITHLSRQIAPNNSKFIVEAYRTATKKPHGYLILNLRQDTPDHLRIRDSFFPKEANFYVDKKDYKKFDLSHL